MVEKGNYQVEKSNSTDRINQEVKSKCKLLLRKRTSSLLVVIFHLIFHIVYGSIIFVLALAGVNLLWTHVSFSLILIVASIICIIGLTLKRVPLIWVWVWLSSTVAAGTLFACCYIKLKFRVPWSYFFVNVGISCYSLLCVFITTCYVKKLIKRMERDSTVPEQENTNENNTSTNLSKTS